MKDSHSYLIFRIAILFILSFNFLFVGAQTGNNFTIGCNTRIYALGEQLTASVDIKANGIGDMVSNYDGTLLFYISGWGVFSDTGKISHNADITGYDNSNQQNRFSVIRLNDSTFYVFYGKIDSTIQKPVAVNFRTQYYSVVRIKNGAPTIDPGEEDIIFYPGSILGQTVIEDALGGSWLIYQTSSNTFNSFYFSETCFGCKPNSSTIDWPLNVGYYFSHNSYLKRSSTGNRISAVSEIQYFTPVPVGTSKITLVTDSVRAGILDLNFDKTTGEVSLQHIIVHQLFKYDPTGAGSYERKKSGFTEISCSYSTNDSLFYYSNRNDQLSKLYIKQFIFSNGQTKELYSNNVGLITELHWFNGEKLYAFFPVTIPSYLYKLIEIQNGNDFQNLNQTLKYGPPIIGDVRCEGKGGYSKYNYIRVKPKFTYRCDATVTFNDLCDHSPGDARITYEVEDTAGSGNLIYKGANPALVYTEDGDYLYRVTYVSDKANYKEIHYDTFHVRIPVKPVA
ncbi:MAG: hypothetical protein GC181_07390, partial [Bacteroidetes bacterium]|nr:hypothetical protein [Bacteroidota bacterium]